MSWQHCCFIGPPITTTGVTNYLQLLCKNCDSPLKSGGKPAFPTWRLFYLRDSFHVESLSRHNQSLNPNRLEVGKVGLPPLFF